MQLNRIVSLIHDDLQALDRVLGEWLYSDIPLIKTVARHLVDSGGKRLRPAVLILAAKSLGYSGEAKHLLGGVIEFIHTATLLHDDVVDQSDLRRGHQTANALFGNAASVLVGDFVYSRAFQMMVRVGKMRVMEVLADATNAISEGEVLQLINCRDPEVDEARYCQVIELKTAKLFEAAAHLGAILGDADEARQAAFARYGKHLGIAFQLVDDVLDYAGDVTQTGKSLGTDLADGKPTLPLIFTLRNGTTAQRELVARVIRDADASALDEVVAVVRASGALEYTLARAQTEAAQARAALNGVAHSQYLQALLEFSDFAVSRTH